MEKEFDPFRDITGEQLRVKTASVGDAEVLTGKLDDCVEQLLREEGILRQVVDIKPVIESELIPDIKTNEKYVLIPVLGEVGNYIESNFKNVPTSVEVSGSYMRLDFGKIECPAVNFSEIDMKFQKNRPLLHYKKNIMSYISEKEDKDLMTALTAAAKISGKYIDATGDDYFNSKHFTQLKNMIDGDRLNAATILSSKAQMNDLYRWGIEVFGNKNIEENWTGGVGANRSKMKSLGPLDVISSIKEDAFTTIYFRKGAGTTLDINEADVEVDEDGKEILDVNGLTVPVVAKKTRKVFFLCDKNMLGTGRTLMPFRSTFKKEGDTLSFGGYESIGMSIFARGVACLEVGVE